MEPADALDRIAYLLERTQEPTYRVRAFRRAAQVARATGTDALRDLAERHRLTDLAGIGDKTARIIVETLGGKTPEYLRLLEEQAGDAAAPNEAAIALRAALKGDCHGHTDWSDGGSPIDVMARAARDLGHQYWSLTDHSARLKVANGLDRERILRQLDEVAALNEQLTPFRILTGVEVDINEDGTLDHDDDILERLDVVVASVHSKLRMDGGSMTKRMLLAISNPHVDILGHCTGRMVVGRGRPESEFDADLVLAACVRFDTALEINCRPERLDPPRRILTRAVELGCRFAIDTDAHAPGQLEWQMYGCERAAECGVDAGRVVNTWDADQLLAWTASHT